MRRRLATLALVGLVVASLGGTASLSPRADAQDASPVAELPAATATAAAATGTPVPPTETLLATPTQLPPTATPCADAAGCGGGKDTASPAAAVDKPGAGDPVAMADEADNRSLTINGTGYIAQIQFVIDIDTYVFTGTAGTRVVIAAYNYSTDPNFEVTFWLKDPNGAYAQYSQVSGYDANGTMHRDALLDAYVLPQTGTYTIGVGLGNGSSTTGRYVVYVSSDTGDRDTLTSGASRSGQIFPISDRDTYYFSAGRGQTVTIAVTKNTGAELDGYIQLWHRDPVDDTWKVVKTDDDSGGSSNPLISSFALPGSGSFAIMVWAFQGKTVGGYTLNFTLSGNPQADTEQWVTSGFDYRGSVPTGGCDRFYYRMVDGETANVVARRDTGSTLDPKIDIYTWEASLIASSDDIGDADGDIVRTALVGIRSASARVVQFYVCSVGSTSGNYVMRISDDSGDRNDFGTGYGTGNRSGAISPAEDRDYFLFDGSAGQWVTMTAMATTNGYFPALKFERQVSDTVWETVASQGNPIRDTTVTIPWLRLDTSSIYRVSVFSVDMATSGSYALTFQAAASGPTATPTRPPATPTPTKKAATSTPTKKAATNTPTKKAATNTPTKKAATKTPTPRRR